MKISINITIEVSDFKEAQHCFDYLWDKAGKYWNVRSGGLREKRRKEIKMEGKD